MDEAENGRFGRLLRAHRVAAGLSQEDLAERAHLSRRTITNLERGVTAPYRETVALLADALVLTERDRAELERAVHRARTPRIDEEPGAAAAGPPVNPGSDPLLVTKLAIPPPRPALIPRSHLLERLRAGLRGPLTLLSAPAGSGKTTLLSTWHTTPQGQNTPLAWVSLNAGDNDTSRFWRYVFTALDRAAPGAGHEALSLLHSVDQLSMETALTTLINAIAAQRQDIILMLDDYHRIEAEPIHRMLAFLLEHLPPFLHVLLATRADPPLPLARMRARGEVAELRAADLRFTGEEAAAFLQTVMGLALTASEVAALEARTEGWIAGLQLAGLSLQGRSRGDSAAFIADFTGSHRYIVDYLLDEVLLRQPEEVQRFLLHTCILDRLCAPLCAAILDGADPSAECIAACQEILETLERNNLFLIALDDERHWYRYHHLFADALCQRQREYAGIPDAAALHRRASAWFEQQDLVEDTIRHALAAGSYDTAADLIPRALRPLNVRGEMQGLTAWFRALPEVTLRTRPDLSLVYAWVLLDLRDLRRAEDYLRYAEEALQASPDAFPADERENLHGLIEAFRAIISALRGDADRAISQALAVLDGLADSDGMTRGDRNRRGATVGGAAGIALGLAHLSQGAAKEAAGAFGRVADIDLRVELAHVVIIAAMGRASAYRMTGDLDLARAAYEETIQWHADHGHVLLLAGSLFTGLADILRERNELDAALELASVGMRLERELGVAGSERWVEWNVCNRLVVARIKKARGDLDGALADVREAQEQLEGFGSLSCSSILAAFEAQLHLACGDLDAAARWSRSVEAGQALLRFGLTPHVFVYASEHLEVAPIQVSIAQGRASDDPAPIHRALALIKQLLKKAACSDLVWLQAKALALQALAFHALGETSEAFSALDRALVLAEPRRATRLFLDEGPAMANLLRDRRSHGANHNFSAALLVALEGEPQSDVPMAPRPHGAELRSQRLVETLTKRELDVLRLLALDQHTPEIAQALYVEVNTVRTHIKHLYSKLDVHSRDQAVWRARDLGLL